MRLRGDVALVTGSSRGIGRTIAVELARRGADVAVNYHSAQGAAAEVVGEIRALGRRAIAVQADMERGEEAARLVETVERELGPIDLLVNNVGDFVLKPLAAMRHDEWHHVLDSNLSSAYYLCRAVLPGMRQRRKGSLCNIGLSPCHLVRGAPNLAAYSIAKTGILILTRSLATEEAPYGITVNCVSPGLIDNGHLPPEQAEWMLKRVPMGRLGRAEEVAEAVAFLLSEGASYVSGANLAVAGGWDWEDRGTGYDREVHDLFVGEPGS
ncbi:MAG TPA: SDR family oxidoreductase [Thermoanaerobaculia bacterium]|nr:SDR family oxidoreductase [Thermoanaerobaculia bacterium]